MRGLIRLSAIALLLVCSTSAALPQSPLGNSRQLIVVTTPDWAAVDGTLLRYERAGDRESWHAVGEPVAVVVGRSGLAWGRGLNPAVDDGGPVKREGDGKSPAGIFSLGTTFGFDDPGRAGVSRTAYLQLVPAIECPDDSASAHYNQLVDRARVAHVDWTSSEKMRSIGGYRWGVVVDHNAPPAPRIGSCIFLHVWNGPARGTAGCTAMNETAIRQVVHWLDSAANPRLVQLTTAVFARLRQSWQLP